MKILVDGDSCPVKETIVSMAARKKIDVVFVVSIASYFDRGWKVQTVMVDSLPQAADIAIVNRVEAGDVVVTQDYGLALLVLGKKGHAISPKGKLFTDQNIDRLMQQRYMNQVARQAGERIKGPKKRAKKDTQHFQQNFQRLLDACTTLPDCSG